jgi:prepilin-type N-terminal cleavage/methylation domain-containing protein
MRKQFGFTVVELVIVVTVIALLLLTVYSMLTIGVRLWKIQGRNIDVKQNLQIALSTMAQEIRNAKRVVRIEKPFGATSYNRITIETAQNELEQYKEVCFFLGSDGSIRRKVPPPPVSSIDGNPIAQGVTYLEFDNSQEPLIKITIRGIGDKGEEFEVSTKILMRNFH